MTGVYRHPPQPVQQSDYKLSLYGANVVLSGTVTATSTGSGVLFAADAMVATCAAVSVLSGTLTSRTLFAGTAASTTVLSGTLLLAEGFIGIAAATSTLLGAMRVTMPIAATCVATSIVTGSLSIVIEGHCIVVDTVRDYTGRPSGTGLIAASVSSTPIFINDLPIVAIPPNPIRTIGSRAVDGRVSLALPWPSLTSPTITWTLSLSGTLSLTGVVPEGNLGPVSLSDLLFTYGWTVCPQPA